MALNIKNPETHQLARELADQTGESLTEAVTVAVRQRLARLTTGRGSAAMMAMAAAVAEIQDFVSTLPNGETRSADETLGYDAHGLPE